MRLNLNMMNGKILPIGLDIGTGSIKLAQLKMTHQEPELIAATSEDIPSSCRDNQDQRMNFMTETIRRLLKSQLFMGRQCIMSMPAEATFIQHLKMPRLSPEQMVNALRIELQNKLPYPAEQAIIRHVIAGDIFNDGETKQEVIVVAAARQTIEAYLDMAERAKLNVIGINIQACAIVECFARLFRRAEDVARTVLFVDMGEASTQVALSHGGKIVFARDLLIGKPGEKLEQISAELSQCIRYYESVFKNQGIERVIFVGGQANDKQFCQLLAQKLNLPAQIGDPFFRITFPNEVAINPALDRRNVHPNWAVAIGLSLGAATAA